MGETPPRKSENSVLDAMHKHGLNGPVAQALAPMLEAKDSGDFEAAATQFEQFRAGRVRELADLQAAVTADATLQPHERQAKLDAIANARRSLTSLPTDRAIQMSGPAIYRAVECDQEICGFDGKAATPEVTMERIDTGGGTNVRIDPRAKKSKKANTRQRGRGKSARGGQGDTAEGSDSGVSDEQAQRLEAFGYPEDIIGQFTPGEADAIITRGVRYAEALKAVEGTKAEAAAPETADDAPYVLETPLENREELRKRIEEVQNRLHRKDRINKTFSQEDAYFQSEADAEKAAYFAALRKHQRSRKITDALPERLGFKSTSVNEGGAELQELKRKWIEARAAQARRRLELVEPRRRERGAQDRSEAINDAGDTLEGIKAKPRAERDIEEVKRRYERRFIAKDLLHGAVKEEQDARLEALRSRDANLVEFLWKSYSNLSPNKKIFISGLTLTAAAGGALATGGLLAAAPMLALGGFGAVMRMNAERQRKETAALKKRITDKSAEKEILRRSAVEAEWEGRIEDANSLEKRWKDDTAREAALIAEYEAKTKSFEKKAGFNFFGLGSWLAGMAVDKVYEKSTDQSKKALSGKDAKGNYVAGNLYDPAALAMQGDALAKSHRTLQATESGKATLKTLSGLATGLAGGAAVGSAFDAMNGPDTANQTGGADAGDAAREGAPAQGGAGDAAGAPEAVAPRAEGAAPAGGPETTPPSAEAAAASASPEAPSGSLSEATIQANSGEGFNSLFAELETDGIESPSAVVEHLRETSPTELSREIQAILGDRSAVMQGGDHVVLDNNQNLWFVRPGEEPQLLFENDPSAEGGFKIHTLEDVRYMEHAAPVPAPREVTPAPEAPAAPADASVPPTEAAVQAAPQQQGSTAPEAAPIEGVRTLTTEEAMSALRGEDVEAPILTDDAAPSTLEDTSESTAIDGAPRTLTTEEAVNAFRTPAPEQAAPDAQSAADTGEGGVRSLTTEEAVEALREGPSEPFTNVNGVEVTPSVPAAYQWQVPGTDMTYPVAYGGSPEEASAWAQQQVQNNPGEIFFFATPIRDSFGAVTAIRMDAWDAGLDGVPRLNEGMVNPNTGGLLPPPNPNDFIRKLP